MIWLHRFATLVAVASLLLIVAGGLVTSTGSGLAVPDWPTSYGYFMFTFPLSGMVGGIFYEHGHRVIASIVGCLTIVLAAWIWRTDPRPWVKRLGLVTLFAVVLQGVLGGITVLYFLPAPVSIGHAAVAQIFFCLTVSLALFTSPAWLSGYTAGDGCATDAPPGAASYATLRRIALITAGVIYVQILIGATMRHTGAGLAIADFPLVFGGLVPSTWNQGIALHYAHRVGALVTALAILATWRHVWTHHRERQELRRPAQLMLALVIAQIALGGWTVLSSKAVAVNTAHVATGALVLVTSVVLTLRANRARFPDFVALGQAPGAAQATPHEPQPALLSSGTWPGTRI